MDEASKMSSFRAFFMYMREERSPALLFSHRLSDSMCLSISFDDVLMICHAHTRHLSEFDVHERSRLKSNTCIILCSISIQ